MNRLEMNVPPHPLLHAVEPTETPAQAAAFDVALQDELDSAPSDAAQAGPEMPEARQMQAPAATKHAAGAAQHATQAWDATLATASAELAAAAPLPPGLPAPAAETLEIRDASAKSASGAGASADAITRQTPPSDIRHDAPANAAQASAQPGQQLLAATAAAVPPDQNLQPAAPLAPDSQTITQSTTPLSQALATLVGHLQAAAKTARTQNAASLDLESASATSRLGMAPQADSQTAAQTASTFAGLLSPGTPHPQAAPAAVVSAPMPVAFVHSGEVHDSVPLALLPVGAQRVHLRLTPDALGVVDLEIRVRDAVVTLAVHTDSSAALQHLVQHRDQLDSQLREHGLSLGDMHLGHHAAGDEKSGHAHDSCDEHTEGSLKESRPNGSATAPTRKRGGIDVVA